MEKIVKTGKIGTAVETLRISTSLNDHATSLHWQNTHIFNEYKKQVKY